MDKNTLNQITSGMHLSKEDRINIEKLLLHGEENRSTKEALIHNIIETALHKNFDKDRFKEFMDQFTTQLPDHLYKQVIEEFNDHIDYTQQEHKDLIDSITKEDLPPVRNALHIIGIVSTIVAAYTMHTIIVGSAELSHYLTLGIVTFLMFNSSRNISKINSKIKKAKL